MHQPARSVSFSALLFLVVMIPICGDTVQLTEAAQSVNSQRETQRQIRYLTDWILVEVFLHKMLHQLKSEKDQSGTFYLTLGFHYKCSATNLQGGGQSVWLQVLIFHRSRRVNDYKEVPHLGWGKLYAWLGLSKKKINK